MVNARVSSGEGRRPALVISNTAFTQRTGLIIICPITNTERDMPFHLPVSASSTLTGFVMVEQVKSVDYRARRTQFVEAAPAELLEDVLAILDVCVK